MPPSKSSRQLAVFLIRLLISKNEYERLEVILSPHTPNSIRPHLPSTADFDERPRSPNSEVGIAEAALGSRDEFLPATVRQGSQSICRNICCCNSSRCCSRGNNQETQVILPWHSS